MSSEASGGVARGGWLRLKAASWQPLVVPEGVVCVAADLLKCVARVVECVAAGAECVAAGIVCSRGR